MDTSNHGKVGEIKYIKMKSDKLESMYRPDRGLKFYDGQILSVEELEEIGGVSAAAPIHVDDSVECDYEVVCEHGTELHMFFY